MLSQAERDALPAEQFALAAQRLFPVVAGFDLSEYLPLIPKSPDPALAKTNLIRLGLKHGAAIPEAWQPEAAALAATFSQEPPVPPVPGNELGADFGVEGGTTATDGMVTRHAPVAFRVGDYKFANGSKFSMTNEDVMAAIADFDKPVPIDDNHRPKVKPDGSAAPPSYFDGQLGEVVKLIPSPDYSAFGLEARIPEWLHKRAEGKPIPLSATFDWKTKKLLNVAITPNPRITDAAMFASPEALEAAFAEQAQAMATPHGQGKLQSIHDMAARGGAKCSPATAAPHAAFTTDAEGDALQKVHDACIAGGAKCSLYDPGKVADTTRPLTKMMEYSAEPPPAPPAVKPVAPVEKIATVTSAVVKTPRELELEAQLATLQAAQTTAQQAAFAALEKSVPERAKEWYDGLRARNLCLPADEGDVLAEFTVAAMDDLRHPAEVHFSAADGKPTKGSRVDQLKAKWARRTPHQLTKELIAQNETVALFNRTTTPDPKNDKLTAAERDAALSLTPTGRALLAEERAARINANGAKN